MTGSFGSLHGVKIPEKLTDDMPLEELPYIEMFYRFVFGEISYYNLEITKDVKPQANNRQSEEAAPTTDTTGENEPKVQRMKRGRCRCEGSQSRNDRSKSLNNILIHSILR